ncbi:MAG: acetyl/propionyl/methylcrotonyl-CoA carboxylase subunit alpha [Castellaniella sp.]
MFNTLLIANRGEIACRIAATARRMGLKTIAVYSDADANAPHVAACDIAVPIGGAAASESYLRADVILEAAARTGADAIHPGYGFLSENADFARACKQAGRIFVGPPAEAIEAMGSKSAAKTLMEQAGVPLVPGYHGDIQDTVFLQGQADEIAYPVLIKASAGGGGKGMRIVDNPDSFVTELQSCRREAASSFGDDRVLLERYIQKPRHVEVQIFTDTHGNAVYLFERDCSVQRRYQKVLEEAPAPGMTAERRKAMGEAAIAAAQATNYVGAGTVEFILEADGRFYFMEMNTRLQVEHPVTEMITGLDLVEWQLRVAAGEHLPLTQDALQLRGHAIEARIYAENPDRGFLPSTGRISVLRFPAHTAFADGDVRIDSGIREGNVISPHYDPMIAKLIVRGEDRRQACRRMLQALEQMRVVGVQTNIAFLHRLVADEAFAQADLDTGLIERRRDKLFPPAQPATLPVLALALAGQLCDQGRISGAGMDGAPPADPWHQCDAWRVSGRVSESFQLMDQGEMRTLTLSGRPGAWQLSGDDEMHAFSWSCRPSGGPLAQVSIQLGDERLHAQTMIHGNDILVFAGASVHAIGREDPGRYGEDASEADPGSLRAPMPGKILSIHAEVGDTVTRGQRLVVMEAMKMEHSIDAPADGKVSAIFFDVGDQVEEGVELIDVESS